MSIKVLVTTAAGKTGQTTCLALLRKGMAVRAFVRQEDKRSRLLQEAGAEIFVGNMEDIKDVRESLIGIQRAYLCMPPAPHMLHKAMLFAVAAEEAHLEAIVWMGQWLSDSQHPALATRETYYIDRILQWMPNVFTTVVNPGWFADNYFLVMEPMAQLGLMPMPLGEGRNAPPSNEDIGRVVAAILEDPQPHHGKIYRPTGSQILSPTEIANIIGEALGREVKYMDIPEKMFFKAIRSEGFGEFYPTVLKYYTADYRQNAFAKGGTTDVVERLTGRPSEDFATIAKRYASIRPEAQRSFSNKVIAMLHFAKLLLTIPYNVDAIEKKWHIPKPNSSRYAIENSTWLKTHDQDNAFGFKTETRHNKFTKPKLVANS